MTSFCHVVTAYLIPQDEILFIDLLESEPLLCFSVLHQVDGAVRAVGNEFRHFEIALRWLVQNWFGGVGVD